jgi:hypothetical protein
VTEILYLLKDMPLNCYFSITGGILSGHGKKESLRFKTPVMSENLV